MNIITSYTRELGLTCAIVFTFLAYYFDFFRDGMMMSGVIVTVVVAYAALVWSEKVTDERDDYIRAKTDRALFILTLLLLLASIIYKTFSHESYAFEVTLLTVLAIAKVIIARYSRNIH
jgi:hypothetical protein